MSGFLPAVKQLQSVLIQYNIETKLKITNKSIPKKFPSPNLWLNKISLSLLRRALRTLYNGKKLHCF